MATDRLEEKLMALYSTMPSDDLAALLGRQEIFLRSLGGRRHHREEILAKRRCLFIELRSRNLFYSIKGLITYAKAYPGILVEGSSIHPSSLKIRRKMFSKPISPLASEAYYPTFRRPTSTRRPKPMIPQFAESVPTRQIFSVKSNSVPLPLPSVVHQGSNTINSNVANLIPKMEPMPNLPSKLDSTLVTMRNTKSSTSTSGAYLPPMVLQPKFENTPQTSSQIVAGPSKSNVPMVPFESMIRLRPNSYLKESKPVQSMVSVPVKAESIQNGSEEYVLRKLSQPSPIPALPPEFFPPIGRNGRMFPDFSNPVEQSRNHLLNDRELLERPAKIPKLEINDGSRNLSLSRLMAPPYIHQLPRIRERFDREFLERPGKIPDESMMNTNVSLFDLVSPPFIHQIPRMPDPSDSFVSAFANCMPSSSGTPLMCPFSHMPQQLPSFSSLAEFTHCCVPSQSEIPAYPLPPLSVITNENGMFSNQSVNPINRTKSSSTLVRPASTYPTIESIVPILPNIAPVPVPAISFEDGPTYSQNNAHSIRSLLSVPPKKPNKLKMSKMTPRNRHSVPFVLRPAFKKRLNINNTYITGTSAKKSAKNPPVAHQERRYGLQMLFSSKEISAQATDNVVPLNLSMKYK